MRVVAIIPARGGSKGIPGKNLQRVGGRSLVARSIAHARACLRIDAVVVSTDDEAIAGEARRCGSEVIARPEMLAGDQASTESVVAHVLAELATQGNKPEIVVLLQCTSPFRAEGQLRAALETFEATGCDSMLSVARFVGFLWQQGPHAGAQPLGYDPQHRPRRQDHRGTWLETGSFYVFTRALFEREGCRLGGHIEAFEVPSSDALEIDEPQDLVRARQLERDRLEDCDGLVQVRWLVLDVDGTLTDGAMFYGEDGSEFKRFDTRDGMGIARWRATGGRVAMITGEPSKSAARRARKLGFDHVVLGCQDKAAALRAFMHKYSLRPEAVFAMGDDLNDLGMSEVAGWFAAPSTARPEVLAVADFVAEAAAGHGAVREMVELLLRHRPVVLAQRAG